VSITVGEAGVVLVVEISDVVDAMVVVVVGFMVVVVVVVVVGVEVFSSKDVFE